MISFRRLTGAGLVLLLTLVLLRFLPSPGPKPDPVHAAAIFPILPEGSPQPRLPAVAPVRSATSTVVTQPQPLAAGAEPAPPLPATVAGTPAQPTTEGSKEAVFDAFQRWVRQTTSETTGNPIDTARLAEGVDLARHRRDALRELIRTNPRRALELAIPETARAALPQGVSELLEERVEGRGNLEVLCVLPEPGRPPTTPPIQRFAVFPDRRFEAYVFGQREFQPTQFEVELRGIALEDRMAVEENTEAEGTVASTSEGSEGRANLALASTPGTPTLKTMLLIRVDFSDLPGEPLSDSRAPTLVKELDQFYRDNSYNRSGFRLIGSGSDVTPLFRMPRTAAYYGGNNAFDTLRTDARAAARNAGYLLSSYNYDVVFLGSVPGFGWSGLGYVGQPGAWIRGTTSTGVTAHEVGHNFGLSHANFWDTSGRSVIGEGESIEYGDKFDTMGAANAGAYHFNARYKRQLGWLKEGEFTVATTNGTYRIYAHDQTETVAGSRGLQVFLNAQTNYWLELRQKFTGKPALLNGAGLRWARRDAGPCLLLDTTPGSTGEKDDSPVALGRTFSDLRAGIHLTPIAKGGSAPAWMDIVVNRGSFLGNRPPTLQLDPPPPQVSTTSILPFQAEATDPDGDALAYYWQFGDDTVSTNSPRVSHQWTASGDYVIRCTVSDLRGGTASRSYPIRVGTPSTFRLAGRITDNGEPVAEVRVSAGANRQTWSDTDGSYVLTGVSRGNVTLSATRENRQFQASTFSNPVAVTANRTGLDFAAVDTSDQAPVTLVAAGSEWKYWDQGSLLGTTWRNLNFNDTAWNTGAAILGYGGDRETTVIGYGSDAGHKYLTSWFRRRFVVENPARLSNVRLSLLRDDGAAVYLNGQELLRDNLPSGILTSETAASSTVSGTAEVQYFEFDVAATRLVAGTNILAVEVHQSSGSSSDTAFDLRLTAERIQTPEAGIHLVRPSSGTVLTAPARIALGAVVGALPEGTPGPVARVEFLANGQVVASAASPPYAAVWAGAPPGDHTLAAAAILADGSRMESPSVSVEVSDPALTPLLVPSGSVWRYLDTGVAPLASWTQVGFDDGAWRSGPARLGYGEDGEFTVVSFGSDPSRRYITTWFRRRFELTDARKVTALRLRLQRDDGAVVYLNGREAFRSGMRTGAVTPALLAQADIKDDAEWAWIESTLDPASLENGANVLAVELHQSSASSTDLGFDCELRATRSVAPAGPPPTMTWQIAGNLLTLRWPAEASGWQLQTVPTVDRTDAWQNVAATPVLNTEFYEQTVDLGSETGAAFFRLTRP